MFDGVPAQGNNGELSLDGEYHIYVGNDNGFITLAKQAKHLGFVLSKRANMASREAKWKALTAVARPISKVREYQFESSRYRRSFIVRNPPLLSEKSKFPRRIFAVWTGENELSPNRKRNLERLQSSLGLELQLVTPSNLGDWVVAEHPIHTAYESLSLVHRSDYLRAYLLHHHGGGYVDVKEPKASWIGAFEAMEKNPTTWISGYRELNAKASTRIAGRMGADIAFNFSKLVGTSSILARSHTPFTGEWMREVDRKMDYYADQLAEFPGGVRGEVIGYPVSWTHLLGRIYQPLQLKYLDHIRPDDSLLLEFTDYQ